MSGLPKPCQARRRRVARILTRHAASIRRIRLTKNTIKITRPADEQLRGLVNHLTAMIDEIAAALRTP